MMNYGNIFVYKNDLPDDFNFTGGDIAIDTEAMGLNNLRDRLCLLQFSTGDDKAHLVQFEPEKYDAPNLKRILSREDGANIFHYARFDLAIIQHYLQIKMRNVYCTKIASRLSRTFTNNHSLKDLCYDILSVKLNKMQQSSDWGAPKLTPPQLEYAASDVLHLHKLRDKLNIMLEREGRAELAKKCFEFLPVRAELDLFGWCDFDIFQHSS